MMKDIFVPNIGDFDEVEIIEIYVSLGEKVEIEQSSFTRSRQWMEPTGGL